MLQATNRYHNSSTSTLTRTVDVAVPPAFPVTPKSRFPNPPSTSLLLRPQDAGPSSQIFVPVVPQVAAPAIPISPLRIPSKRNQPPPIPPRAREPKRHSIVSNFSPGTGHDMSSTLLSQAGGNLEFSLSRDSNESSVSPLASDIGRVTSIPSPARGYGDICDNSAFGHLASPSIMLRGGRDPGTSASSSTRRKPKGARPPSIRVVDKVASQSTSTGTSFLTPPPTADLVKRAPLTPSELRAKILQNARARAPSDSEVLASPFTRGSLKRSSRVRRDGGHHAVSRSEGSLLHIITDFSQPLSDVSLQDTPPLSATRFVKSSGMYSPASSAPSSPRETQTPHDSPVYWKDSPCTANSNYSINSVQPWQESPCALHSASSKRGDPMHIEWDDTGYLSPEQPFTGSVDYNATNDARSGVHLKRQNTDIIKELLRLRRGRAGME